METRYSDFIIYCVVLLPKIKLSGQEGKKLVLFEISNLHIALLSNQQHRLSVLFPSLQRKIWLPAR